MFIKTVLAAALTASIVALSLPGVAEASHRHRNHHRHNGHHAGAAAAIGLGFGVILGSAFSQRRYRSEPYYDRPVNHRYGRRPWTDEWYRYCGQKYRSFNPKSGYFLGYDGEYHFCR